MMKKKDTLVQGMLYRRKALEKALEFENRQNNKNSCTFRQ